MSNVAYKTDTTYASATKANMGPGLTPGDFRLEGKNKYIFALAGGTIGDGYAASPDISLTAADSALVFVATSATAGTSGVWCINNTGAAVTTGQYFWGLVDGVGYGYCDTNGTITAGIALCVESTAGELMEYTDSVRCGVALESISADTKGACYFQCMTGVLTFALLA